MLDFVPNHTGLDHPWVEDHPEYYIAGTELDLARAPQNYTWVKRRGGDRLLAYGRDPYFPGWPDTLQLNYGNPATQEAMIGELLKIAGQCDGVRCDMAMLVLPEVFERTWGIPSQPFWPKATQRVREQSPDFCFMAEVYWDLEWTLQQQGFDYTYDKRLYDRLRDRHARPVREHFRAGLDYQDKLARFLENHDEPRAAATFPPGVHEAAAVITFLSPGLRFFHQGQFEGRKKRISPHLGRAPDEPDRPGAGAVLRPAPRRPASTRRPRRAVAIARVRGRLGRQLDLRLLHRVRLARPGRRAAAGRGELRRQPEPVLRPAPLRGPRRQDVAVAGPSRARRPMTGTATACKPRGCSWISANGSIMSLT